MFDFLDPHRIYIIAHIFGAILGAGGAFASDSIFLSSVKDGMIDATEMRFIRLGSKLVWAGLTLLIISGLFLFFLSPEEYLASSKFLAKMSIVGIIFLNGIIFHVVHIPLLGRIVGIPLRTSSEFVRRSTFIMVSGAVSMTSWVSAVILGLLRGLPYSYGEIMGIYFLLLLFTMTVAILSKKKLLHL